MKIQKQETFKKYIPWHQLFASLSLHCLAHHTNKEIKDALWAALKQKQTNKTNTKQTQTSTPPPKKPNQTTSRLKTKAANTCDL